MPVKLQLRLEGCKRRTTNMSYENLKHSKYNCKYHLVFVPKYRKKKLYGKIRKFLGEKFHELSKYKGCEIIEGYMVTDHVHMLIKIPPKYAVSSIIGYIKGKSAIAVARQFSGRKKILREKVYGHEDMLSLQ